MKLSNLFEGYYDPPEYPDSSGMGFYDDELDEVEDQFNLVLWDRKSGLFVTEHKNTKKKYLSHTDAVDIEYYMADMYPEEDEDEDGRYTYHRLDKDNAEMVEESLTMYATIAYEEEDIGKDFDEWETGIALIEVGNILLRGLYINERETYNTLLNLIKEKNARNFNPRNEE